MHGLARATIVALALIGGARSVSAQTYSVTWWTVDGGGATGTTGGTYSLSGTAGQPDASGGHTGGTYSVAGGFWPASLPATPLADLSLSLSDSPDPVTGLQPLTYTIAVGNAGPADASTISVVDTLPAGVVFQSAGGTGWACGETAGTVTCTRSALAAGPAPSLTIVATAPAAAGTLTNTATVSGAQSDPVPGNNSDSETTTVVAAPQSDLSVTLSDGGVEGRYGEPLTYILTVTNSGPASITGATVTDNFPAGLTGVQWTCLSSGSCPASGSGNISALVSLSSGGTATFTATGTVVTGTASPLTNTATITPPATVVDPNPANNSATETTPVGPVGFYTVTPCRVADTRNPPGPSGGPFLSANTTRTFPVGGRCGVPLDARAVAIILTVAQQTELGNLRLYPHGGAVPTASAINFVPGRARANNAILKLGTGGQIDVQCDMVPGSTGHTHFLFDVFGYFK